MSVKWGQTIVMAMPPVLTLLGVSTVHVTVGMMEMESTAQVSFFFNLKVNSVELHMEQVLLMVLF